MYLCGLTSIIKSTQLTECLAHGRREEGIRKGSGWLLRQYRTMPINTLLDIFWVDNRAYKFKQLIKQFSLNY